MIKGFYAAVSAMLANSARQQILAHNVANLETPGFKQVLTSMEDFWQTQVDYSPGNLLQDNRLTRVGALGLGTELGPEMVDFTQGGLQLTENPFDLAVQGDGFFMVQTPEGLRYTRDGRFIRDAEGTLVTVDGYQVLNRNRQPIEIPNGLFSVGYDGTITVNGTQVAQLGLASFENAEEELTRAQGNLFEGPDQPTGDGEIQVVQGYLEMSNANPTQLMTQLVEVARTYEAAQKMVQNQDELLGKVISSLGRIG